MLNQLKKYGGLCLTECKKLDFASVVLKLQILTPPFRPIMSYPLGLCILRPTCGLPGIVCDASPCLGLLGTSFISVKVAFCCC